MRKTEEIVIDEVRYSTTQYSGTKGMLLLAKLVKIVGKPLGLLTAAGGMAAEFQPDLVGRAISALTDQLEPDEFVKTMKEILEGTLIFTDQGNRLIIFDTDFSGRMGHLLKLIREILKFQYDDFLGGLAGVTATLAASTRAADRIPADRVKAL